MTESNSEASQQKTKEENGHLVKSPATLSGVEGGQELALVWPRRTLALSAGGVATASFGSRHVGRPGHESAG